MSRILGLKNKWDDRITSLAIQDINTDQMKTVNLNTPPVFNPSGIFESQVIPENGRIRLFECSTVIDDTADGVISTTFYDTSDTIVGDETPLFSFLSFCTKASGSTRGYQEHVYQFPGKGLVFKRGIRVKCERIDGTPTFVAIQAMFYYHNP